MSMRSSAGRRRPGVAALLGQSSALRRSVRTYSTTKFIAQALTAAFHRGAGWAVRGPV